MQEIYAQFLLEKQFLDRDWLFKCAALIGDAPPNNGMHPTRDTTALIIQQRLGRAGDAGR